MNASVSPKSHLTPATPAGWAFWRKMECRTAGFPVQAIKGFAAPAVSDAAQHLCAAEMAYADAWNAIRKDVKAQIKARLDLIRTIAEDDAQVTLLENEISQFRVLAKATDQRKLSPVLQYHLGSIRTAEVEYLQEAKDFAREKYQQCFADARHENSEFVKFFARQEQFRTAIIWQNPSLVGKVLDPLLAPPGLSGSRLRRSEELIANYAQRYCCKNDTIGFFGPVGWASFAPHSQGILLTTGPELLRKRTVYFEDWAIAAIAAHFSQQKSLRPWMTPRRMPYLRLENQQLHFPVGAQVQLSAEEAAVMAACTGQFCAEQIATHLLQNPYLDFIIADDVFMVMEELAQKQRLTWDFVVRVGDPWPEKFLRSQIEAITLNAERNAALEALAVLEKARADLSQAASSAPLLAAAMQQINLQFEELSGAAATRKAGVTYGARTIVYEDCERAMQLTIGVDVMTALQSSLEPILCASRWYCHQLATLFQEHFQQIFDQLSSSGAVSRSINFPSFWLHAQGLFFGENKLSLQAISDEFERKWQQIFQIDGTSGRRLELALGQHAAKIAEVFQVSNCGWRGACHQSPDVMLAAPNVDAIANDQYFFVLGEVHVGLNTLINHSALNQAPDAQELLTLLRHDRGAPRLIPLLSREGSQQPIRVQTVTEVGYDIEVCYAHDAKPLAPERAIPIAELQVTEDAGRLVVTHNGQQSFDLLDVFGEFLSGFAASHFRLFKVAPYTPRISLGKLVIQRESWRFACDTLDFVNVKDEAQCYLEVQRWRLQLHIPRLVFVKVPWEQKPFHIDFDSPLFVRILIKQIRRVFELPSTEKSYITLSEMLPQHDECWLSDSAQQTYTSELRIVALNTADIAR